MPALEQMLDSFPFTILGFHSDNGSEYIKQGVAVFYKNCSLNLLNHDQDILMIMLWLKVKMHQLSERYLVIRISLKNGLPRSINLSTQI